MSQSVRMIDAVGQTELIKRYYNYRSKSYAWMVAPLEEKPRMMALDRARIQPGDRVLEVAVGPGVTLPEIAKRVAPGTPIHGVDLSPGMLEKARNRLSEAGITNVILQEADARKLPFADASFDVLYNSYMLDLIHLADMPVVLAEFYRVLKPGGRLILVNLSKPDPSRITWFERLYRWLPESIVPWVVGACRPVVMAPHVSAAGFMGVEREFVPNSLPSEIVVARKPA